MIFKGIMLLDLTSEERRRKNTIFPMLHWPINKRDVVRAYLATGRSTNRCVITPAISGDIVRSLQACYAQA